jgi:hypothetical protein
LVVVDKYSKYAHFLPLLHPYTAFKVAKIFMSSIYKLHRMPEAIISDRDRIFTSTLWQEFFKLAGTQLRMGTSYHPQSDGQTERVNQCLETFLRCFLHACPTKWTSWLSMAEFWYNTSFHSALGRSPFEVLYGRSPRQFGVTREDTITYADLAVWLSKHELMSRIVKQHLLRAEARMKQQADINRSDRQFEVGDQVYLKLQPYIQTSIGTRANHKLAFKYFGPFAVLQRVGSVAYKLDLPASSSVHPIFHVSLLKKAVPAKHQVSSTLHDASVQLQFPVHVLDRRSITRGGASSDQVLVRWSDFDDVLSTWEDYDALRQQFPRAAA